MANNSRFVIITPENLRIISENLSKKEGRILIAEPGPGSYRDDICDVYLHLFAHPLIDTEKEFLYTQRGSAKRGEESWQTNWEDDREYFLRSRPQPSKDSVTNFCRELFDRLQVGAYEFHIGFQSMVGGSVFPSNGLSMYVLPGDETLKQAMIYGLKYVVNKMPEQNKIFLLGVADKIADYAIKDFKDNKIFKANISAGMEADIISG